MWFLYDKMHFNELIKWWAFCTFLISFCRMKSFQISSKIWLFFWKDFWLTFKITTKRLFFFKETKESQWDLKSLTIILSYLLITTIYSLFESGYPITTCSMSLDVSSLLKQSVVGTSHMRSCCFCSIYFTLNFCWFHTVCHIKGIFSA